MSDREARMPALVPAGGPRVFGEDKDDSGFHLGTIPDTLKVMVAMKMQSNQIYKMQLMNKHFYGLMQNYPDLCKPAVIVDISTADQYHPKLYNKPGSHVLAATMKQMPGIIPETRWDPSYVDIFPGDCLLKDLGIISHRIIYEKPNCEGLVESCREYFEKRLTMVRIAEITIRFDEVPVTSNMMALMEECLARDKQCYDDVTLHLITRATDLGAFANLIHAIQPKRLMFEGNHSLNIREIRLPDCRLFIRDNEMGSSEVMIRVARIIEDWWFGERNFDFLYIKFGAGGALLPGLVAYNGFPLKTWAKLNAIAHYMVPRDDNLELHIRINHHQVRLTVLDKEEAI